MQQLITAVCLAAALVLGGTALSWGQGLPDLSGLDREV